MSKRIAEVYINLEKLTAVLAGTLPKTTNIGCVRADDGESIVGNCFLAFDRDTQQPYRVRGYGLYKLNVRPTMTQAQLAARSLAAALKQPDPVETELTLEDLEPAD